MSGFCVNYGKGVQVSCLNKEQHGFRGLAAPEEEEKISKAKHQIKLYGTRKIWNSERFTAESNKPE